MLDKTAAKCVYVGMSTRTVGPLLTTPAAMMRRSVLKQAGIHYQARFSPSKDTTIMLEIIKASKLHTLPDVLVDYRWCADTTSKHQVHKMTATVGALFEYAKENFPETFAMYRVLTRSNFRNRLIVCAKPTLSCA